MEKDFQQRLISGLQRVDWKQLGWIQVFLQKTSARRNYARILSNGLCQRHEVGHRPKGLLQLKNAKTKHDLVASDPRSNKELNETECARRRRRVAFL